MKGIFFAVLSILALLLTACNAATPKEIHSPITLHADPAVDRVVSAAVAVGKDGMKYFAWSECDNSSPVKCSVSVAWTKIGESNDPVIVQRPAEASDLSPDITVTDSGTVYLVWVRRTVTGGNTSSIDCFSHFDPNSPGTVTCDILGGTFAQYQTGQPKIASYGNVVYAVYGFLDPDNANAPALRYRQLNLLDASGGMVHGRNSYRNIAPEIAVSSEGTLHVAWLEVNDSLVDSGTRFLYANNHATKGTLSLQCPCAWRADVQASDTPAIGISPADGNRVYVAYTYATELITTAYPADGSTTGVSGATLPAANWTIQGSPALAVFEQSGSSDAYIAFSATNDSYSGDNEIFVKTFNGDPAVHTSNTLDDMPPRAIVLKETRDTWSQNHLVLLWRVRGVSGGYGDVYLETTPSSAVEKVIYQGSNPYSTLDLAVNGLSIGGAWINTPQQLSLSSTEQVAAPLKTYSHLKVAFNIHEIGLPIVQK